MKITHLLLFFPFLLFCQSKIEITPAGLINTQQVYELDKINSIEIYRNLNKFFQKKAYNPEKVMRGNIENEFIGFDAVISINDTSIKSLEIIGSIEIKDNKIRINVDNVFEIFNLNINKIDIISNPVLNDYFNNDGSVKKKFITSKQNIENTINNFIIDIIKNSSEKKNDW